MNIPHIKQLTFCKHFFYCNFQKPLKDNKPNSLHFAKNKMKNDLFSHGYPSVSSDCRTELIVTWTLKNSIGLTPLKITIY